MWRCVNNLSGDCTGEPDWEQSPSEMKLDITREKATEGYQHSGTCKLDSATCGKFKSHAIDDSVKVPAGTYTHTLIANANAKTKSKAKKVEKKEKPMQGSFF